jgi:hypothetical protein
VNADGIVNAADIWALIGIIADTTHPDDTTTGSQRADVNADGVVNVADMLYIINIMATDS